MTGLSAEYLLLDRKGLIKDGYDADLVIFDFDNLLDTATYANSNSITEGINYVYLKGEKIYENRKFTGNHPGKILRHNK